MSTELQAIWRTKSLDFDMRKYHVKNQAKILGQGFFNSGGDSEELKYFMSFISLLLLQIICILKRKFYFCRSQWILFLEEFFARMCQNWKIYSEMKQRELEIDLSHNSSSTEELFE